MTWWFIILGFSTVVVVFVAIALVMRVRRHMKASDAKLKEALVEIEREREAGKF